MHGMNITLVEILNSDSEMNSAGQSDRDTPVIFFRLVVLIVSP